MEAGIGDYPNETKDSESDGCAHFQGWNGKEDWECHHRFSNKTNPMTGFHTIITSFHTIGLLKGH